jgi:hypothetical protein
VSGNPGDVSHPADALVAAIADEVERRVLERLAVAGEGRWLRGGQAIAAYLGCAADRVYALSSAQRIPTHHDGSTLVARTDELDAWLRDGGGLRP